MSKPKPNSTRGNGRIGKRSGGLTTSASGKKVAHRWIGLAANMMGSAQRESSAMSDASPNGTPDLAGMFADLAGSDPRMATLLKFVQAQQRTDPDEAAPETE